MAQADIVRILIAGGVGKLTVFIQPARSPKIAHFAL
jgi:hypothetical protein